MPYDMRPVTDLRKEVIEAMTRKGISARKIMRDTGLSHITVNKFLRGEGGTRDQTVVKLCLYLGLNWYSEEIEA